MEEKVLYVTDLDGTLMRGDLKISDFSIKTINGLVEKGMASLMQRQGPSSVRGPSRISLSSSFNDTPKMVHRST